MKFLIAERISANKYKTPEGYLVCVDSVLARTGKQTYRKNEIFVDCNDETEIEVDRKPEEVFSEATLASFENKPITIEHPDEDVNTGNFKNLAVGFVRDIHRGKDNGQDVMLGTLVITDEEAISAVESGELLDLSCGYDCDIEDSANPQQRNIRGNHVALCENGRAGIARIVDSINDVTMKEYVFKFIPDEFASKPVEVKFPCLSNVAALATLRRSWSWIKMISVTVDGKEVKYQNGKIIDSEEIEMKDKLIDIPSDVMNKIESQFKSKGIRISKKGKTFSGRIHYQIEFNGKVKDLVKKLEEIESFVDRLNIPMTFAANANKDDTFATAGVDFDKQHIDDSNVEDGKNAAENAVETAMSELNIDISKLRENKDKVIMKISSKGLYGRTQAGWFVDDYIKNHVNDSVHDEDLITEAINDEVATIELYNTILAGNLDDETRAIIEEIRDDENDHLVKLTKLKNNIPSNDEDIEDEDEEIVNDEATYSYSFPRFTSQDKIASAKYKLKIVYNSGSETEVHGTLSNIQKFAKEYLGYQLHNSYLEKISDSEEIINDAGRPYVDIKVEQDFAREIESRSKRYNLYVLARQQSGKLREITLVGEKTNANPLRSIESLIKDFELEKSDYAIKYFKDSEEKVDDAMQTFEIRWIDTYKKSKGYSKEEYLHVDKIKANTLSEALKKLADDVALAGVGTMNAMIVSIHSDKASYMYSGKLGELVKKVKDSSKIERAICAIRAMRKI